MSTDEQARRLAHQQRTELVASCAALTLAQVAAVRGTTEDLARQWLHRQRDAQRLVVVAMEDGTDLVPAFQLDGLGSVRDDVAARTQRLVAARVGPWAVWHWWTSTDPELQATPVEALEAGRVDELDAAVVRQLEGRR